MKLGRLAVRPRSVVVTVAALFLALVATAAVLGVDPRGWAGRSGAQRENPFAGRAVYADPDSPARRAASAATGEDGDLIRAVAAVPTAVWLTPEATGLDEIEHWTATVVRRAAEAGEVPLFVVYGLPNRDCAGGFSRGGLEAGEYRVWVERAARGMKEADGRVVAVLEPDALAMLADCPDADTRVELLSHARAELDRARVTTYLDAGHSDWIAPDVMAERLRRVGVGEARGFAVNVAAYNGEADEIAYAERLADELDDGSRYVMDTGRNGSGSSGEWCNPAGRALGQRPGEGEGRLDARLWIKPPGESDGTCGGGPPAGTWWNERAADLARRAGW